jgi:DNA-binding LacI/PurR family transcriptional regulator
MVSGENVSLGGAAREFTMSQRTDARAGAGDGRPIPARMADIALLAGVSLQTVSRALNNSGRISAATREKVLRVAKELDYQRNSAARALVTRRSGVVGIVATDMDQYGPRITMLAVERELREAGYGVAVSAWDGATGEALSSSIARMAAQGVDATVLILSHTSTLATAYTPPRDMPLIIVKGETADTTQEQLIVGIDQREGARLATQHLLDLGHGTVHHVAGPEGWIDSKQRVQGWRETLFASGRDVPPILFTGDWTARGGYNIGLELARRRDFTAVFVANDQMAVGMCRAFVEVGVSVPGDVSIVGFDDLPEAAYYTPPLSTVRQDLLAVGTQAAEVTVRAMTGQVAAVEELIKPTLIVRCSTARPR